MSRETFATFGPKFMDVMVGVVLGLGFQWWPDLREPWQFLAFVLVYLIFVAFRAVTRSFASLRYRSVSFS